MMRFNEGPNVAQSSVEKGVPEKAPKEEEIPSGESLQYRRIGDKKADEVFTKALQNLDDPNLVIDETFVRHAESMARNSGIGELSELILDLYAVLRSSTNKETDYFLGMGDQKLLAEVLYLLREDFKLDKFMERYPNIFPLKKVTNVNE
ncbi:MAG: hypothetical protein KBD52_00975 [Candidatus Pacebacteria bacterium]|nr:hypothetical protein [Candidatus Paceibacterota bacterium]